MNQSTSSSMANAAKIELKKILYNLRECDVSNNYIIWCAFDLKLSSILDIMASIHLTRIRKSKIVDCFFLHLPKVKPFFRKETI